MGVSSCPELGRPQDPSTRRGGPVVLLIRCRWKPSSKCSMKIMRWGFRRADGERFYDFRFQMNDLVLVLHHSRNQHEPFMQHRHSVSLIKIWRDDDAGRTGFILKRHEYQTFCGSRSLPGNHRACNGGFLAMRKILQLDRRLDAPA